MQVRGALSLRCRYAAPPGCRYAAATLVSCLTPLPPHTRRTPTASTSHTSLTSLAPPHPPTHHNHHPPRLPPAACLDPSPRVPERLGQGPGLAGRGQGLRRRGHRREPVGSRATPPRQRTFTTMSHHRNLAHHKSMLTKFFKILQRWCHRQRARPPRFPSGLAPLRCHPVGGDHWPGRGGNHGNNGDTDTFRFILPSLSRGTPLAHLPSSGRCYPLTRWFLPVSARTSRVCEPDDAYQHTHTSEWTNAHTRA